MPMFKKLLIITSIGTILSIILLFILINDSAQIGGDSINGCIDHNKYYVKAKNNTLLEVD